MSHRISIVTVNYKAHDFLYLLRESIRQYSSEKVELIVVDNTEQCVWETYMDPFDISHKCHTVSLYRNIGHGAGLNLGAALSQTPYTMFLDVDCHFLKKGWEDSFVVQMETCDVVAGRGVPVKPIRPACMFMKTEIAKKYDWRDTPGYKGHRVTPDGYDVAIKAYLEMNKDGVNVRLIDSISSRYKTISGEEWCIEGVPYVYHHWHGAHLKERQVDFPNDDLFANKDQLFRQIPWRIASELI